MLVRFITKTTGQKSLENLPETPVEEQKLFRGRVFVRSSRREVFCERVILKNFTMFRKTAVLKYVFKVACLQAFLSYEYCENFQNTYFAQNMWTAASGACQREGINDFSKEIFSKTFKAIIRSFKFLYGLTFPRFISDKTTVSGSIINFCLKCFH